MISLELSHTRDDIALELLGISHWTIPISYPGVDVFMPVSTPSHVPQKITVENWRVEGGTDIDLYSDEEGDPMAFISERIDSTGDTWVIPSEEYKTLSQHEWLRDHHPTEEEIEQMVDTEF